MNNFQDKANFIWQVADDILRGTFKQHEYGDVILPFVVLRRLDCVLENAWRMGMKVRWSMVFVLMLTAGFAQDHPSSFQVMFYNVENFFDPFEDSLTRDEEFTPDGSRRSTIATGCTSRPIMFPPITESVPTGTS